MNIHNYWKATLQQDAAAMKEYFHSDAVICWHNTNERFTVDEFIRANCEYPDNWEGEIEKLVEQQDCMIAVVHVYATNKPISFHVTSFARLRDDKITHIDEYWGEDGQAPQWRIEKHIGTCIHS